MGSIKVNSESVKVVLDKVDANKDGCISRAELKAASDIDRPSGKPTAEEKKVYDFVETEFNAAPKGTEEISVDDLFNGFEGDLELQKIFEDVLKPNLGI